MNATIKFVIAGVLALVTSTALATDFYVSTSGNNASPGTQARPFATIERARDAIRDLKKTGMLKDPVTVWLAGGTYTLARGVQFGPEDSGTAACPITYTAAGPESVILDGGRRIAGWQRYDDRLWVATLPDAASGQWKFRQLFVNGQQRVRARIPNEGFLRVAACPQGTPKTADYHKDCDMFQFKSGDIRADWTNLSDVEIIVYHFWTDSHLRIKSVDTKSNLVTFVCNANKVFTDDFTENGARYIVDNVFEGLDAPGEWYLNRHTGQLFYYPMPGEDLAKAEVVAPFAPALLRLEGKAADHRYVEYLRFRNLSFTHSEFELPPSDANGRVPRRCPLRLCCAVRGSARLNNAAFPILAPLPST